MAEVRETGIEKFGAVDQEVNYTPNITKEEIQNLRERFDDLISKIESGEVQVERLHIWDQHWTNHNDYEIDLAIQVRASLAFSTTPQRISPPTSYAVDYQETYNPNWLEDMRETIKLCT